RHLGQILAVEKDLAARHFVRAAPRQDLSQCALPGAVRTHDGMNLTRLHGEIDPLQDLLAVHGHEKITNLEHEPFLVRGGHQPTLPSKLTDNSFRASTANSIGSSRNTSLQKPFTIIDT